MTLELPHSCILSSGGERPGAGIDPSAGPRGGLTFCRLVGGGGEGEAGRSLIALVDSLLRAIFLSDGGGGICTRSSSGVSDEFSCIGTG
jgi:hypothetical protein